MKKRFIMLGLALVLAMSTPVMASENETAIIPETEDAETSIDNAEESDIPEENTTSITDEEIVEVDDDTANETISVSEPYEEAEEAIEEEEDLLEAGSSKKIVLSQTSITVDEYTIFELNAKTEDGLGVDWYCLPSDSSECIHINDEHTHEEFYANGYKSIDVEIKDNNRKIISYMPPGEYTIEARREGYQTAKCTVTVTKATGLKKIELSQTNLTVEYGKPIKIITKTEDGFGVDYRISTSDGYEDLNMGGYNSDFDDPWYFINGNNNNYDNSYDIKSENGYVYFNAEVKNNYLIITDLDVGTYTIEAHRKGYQTAECKVTVIVPEATVRYRTHVQKIGWQPYVQNGELSGTTGKSLRLEAIIIDVSNNPLLDGISYSTHVQTYGWQDSKSNNEMAGTTQQGKRLEAIEIDIGSQYYDVYYQTHVQHFGWTGWACNGERCGSAGYGYRLEGIRIKIVKKGDPAPGKTSSIYFLNPKAVNSIFNKPSPKGTGALLGYTTHVQTYGWQNYVYDGAMSGTSGQSKRLEAIQIGIIDGKSPNNIWRYYSGNIVYRTHVQTYGWQNWRTDWEESGTYGQAKRLEGIQIYLTGDLADHYDIYYCVHAQTYGWLDWAKNGEMAGTAGLSKRLEGIKILLVEKGGKAPGSTKRPYVLGPGGRLPDNPYVERIL